jgi:hypothetical protein
MKHKLNYYRLSARRCDICRIYTTDRLGDKYICSSICKPELRETYKNKFWSLEKGKCVFCNSKSEVMIGNISICRSCGKDLKL